MFEKMLCRTADNYFEPLIIEYEQPDLESIKDAFYHLEHVDFADVISDCQHLKDLLDIIPRQRPEITAMKLDDLVLQNILLHKFLNEFKELVDQHAKAEADL